MIVAVLIGVAAWWQFLRDPVVFEVTDGMAHILAWEERHTIQTRLGTVTGRGDGRVQAYLGVPYAEPPVGARRFLPPIAKAPWEGTHDATFFPNIAWQSASSVLDQRDASQMSEDALYLNIFTPSTDGATRPVLFWIHGGSYVEGSANGYDGSILAEQGDAVIVAINYRLGIFGFFDLSAHGEALAGSASNGIRDQLAALNWVRNNIADYGGNPNNITLFGESAGGGSVLALIATPAADGLYQQAIVHSGGMIAGRPADQTREVAEHLGVPLERLVGSLRSVAPAALIEMQQALSLSTTAHVDGTVITRSSNDAILERRDQGVPLIAGYNRDEGQLFSLIIPAFLHPLIGPAVAAAVVPEKPVDEFLDAMEEAYPDDSGTRQFERIWDELLIRGTTNSAVRASAAGAGGWLYRFDMPVQQGINRDVGAVHGAEIAFTFNAFASSAPTTAFFYDKNDPSVQRLALDWSNTILQFARTGNPNGAGLPAWPEYTAETREVLILDADPRVEAMPMAADRARWGDTQSSAADFYP